MTDRYPHLELIVAGYLLAIAGRWLPIVGVAGFVVGLVVATRPGRGAHGAAIVLIAVAMTLLGAAAAVTP